MSYFKKKFEYQQVEYSKYPSPEELNEEGANGWEIVMIDKFTKQFWDYDLECYYKQEFYRVTFKRELYETNDI